MTVTSHSDIYTLSLHDALPIFDVKDDLGNITFPMDDESPYADIGTNYINNPEEMMKRLEEEEIYPIARIVVFKDTVLAEERPDLSFKENGQVWKNGRGEAFVNPFLKEIWEYNIEVAKMAAELGFKEIQFDYVRFAEGFELIDERVEYSQGDYAEYELENVQKRVEAVTDFEIGRESCRERVKITATTVSL